MTIEIKVTNTHGFKEVEGFVDDYQVLKVNTVISDKWHTATSTCLPSDIEKAAEYVECMKQVFDTMANIKQSDNWRKNDNTDEPHGYR